MEQMKTPNGINVKTEKHFLDISDEVCPMSFVLTKLALEKLDDGQKLELVCQAGEPVANITRQLKDEGHEIKGVKKEGNSHFRLLIVKRA